MVSQDDLYPDEVVHATLDIAVTVAKSGEASSVTVVLPEPPSFDDLVYARTEALSGGLDFRADGAQKQSLRFALADRASESHRRLLAIARVIEQRRRRAVPEEVR